MLLYKIILYDELFLDLNEKEKAEEGTNCNDDQNNVININKNGKSVRKLKESAIKNLPNSKILIKKKFSINPISQNIFKGLKEKIQENICNYSKHADLALSIPKKEKRTLYVWLIYLYFTLF